MNIYFKYIQIISLIRYLMIIDQINIYIYIFIFILYILNIIAYNKIVFFIITNKIYDSSYIN